MTVQTSTYRAFPPSPPPTLLLNYVIILFSLKFGPYAYIVKLPDGNSFNQNHWVCVYFYGGSTYGVEWGNVNEKDLIYVHWFY